MEKIKRRQIKFHLTSVSELQDPQVSMDKIKQTFKELAKTKSAMREFIKNNNYESSKHEIQNLIMLISDTNERIDLMGNTINYFYEFTRTAIMAQFHSMEQLHDAIDELKTDPTKKETLDKIDSLRKEQATLHEKYDKIEPIVDGVDKIVKERSKSMDN